MYLYILNSSRVPNQNLFKCSCKNTWLIVPVCLLRLYKTINSNHYYLKKGLIVFYLKQKISNKLLINNFEILKITHYIKNIVNILVNQVPMRFIL